MKSKVYLIIKVIQKPYNLLPKGISNILWNIFSLSESKIAILYRYLYLTKYANRIGRNVFIGKFVTIKNIDNLSIGNDVSIHAYSYIDAFGKIEIGNSVSIANHTTLISSDHTWDDRNMPIKYNPVDPKRIIIENDVWIAAGVRVLGDVTINKRNVIGAGAVVNKSTEENCVYVGVPIKKVKEI
ncbi:acyltransferase [Staphylococcus xylosus]|uniref:acyltransferase n=1 Tax=Staphylococcus xylosus TaxID=1288 RepID=UPI002DBC517A|nr:acyltransferase [Staphylococcus xylosus]MEB7800880.1 acyltransferase [Staphylococcus xylosus]